MENNQSQQTDYVDPGLLLLKPKQKVFADARVAGMTLKAAAIEAYGANPASAAAFAAGVMKSNKVRAYIASKALTAAQRVEGLASDAKNEAVKLAANKDILDRAGYKVPDDPPQPAGNTYNILFSAEARADVAAMEEVIKARLTGNAYDEAPTTPDKAF